MARGAVARARRRRAAQPATRSRSAPGPCADTGWAGSADEARARRTPRRTRCIPIPIRGVYCVDCSLSSVMYYVCVAQVQPQSMCPARYISYKSVVPWPEMCCRSTGRADERNCGRRITYETYIFASPGLRGPRAGGRRSCTGIAAEARCANRRTNQCRGAFIYTMYTGNNAPRAT